MLVVASRDDGADALKDGRGAPFLAVYTAVKGATRCLEDIGNSPCCSQDMLGVPRG